MTNDDCLIDAHLAWYGVEQHAMGVAMPRQTDVVEALDEQSSDGYQPL